MAVFAPMPELTPKEINRFWSKVHRGADNECWPWLDSPVIGGYGRLKVRGQSVRSNRLAYFIQHGIDPLELPVLHSCDNPPCCNGKHLRADTYQSNTRESVTKGRANTARGERHGSRTQPESRTRGERSGNAKLTADTVLEIRRLYANGGKSQQVIADMFNISRENVGLIVRNKRWAHLPSDVEHARVASQTNRARAGELHPTAKLTEDDIRYIRQRYAEGSISYKTLAKKFGVTLANIRFIILRRTWNSVA